MCIYEEETIAEENMVIPSRSVVVGRPARVIRHLNENGENMIKKMRSNNIKWSSNTNVLLSKYKKVERQDVEIRVIKSIK